MSRDDDVVASDREVLEIAEVEALLEEGRPHPFSEGELAYARSKSDPARRLAARLAAKRVAARLLGPGVGPADVEVVPGAGGPPRLRLSEPARARLEAMGARRTLVSLTHERRHAAAVVLFVRSAAP